MRSERPLEGWAVELYRNGQLVQSTLTDATGSYVISGIVPNYATAESLRVALHCTGRRAEHREAGQS